MKGIWQQILTESAPQSSSALSDYLRFIANKGLMQYKLVIHTGGKVGESLWTHIMNLVTLVEQLHPLFQLTDQEYRCVLLALTIHDINKVPRYNKEANDRSAPYAKAANIDHIRAELEHLQVRDFFPEWQRYLHDIKYLSDAHQEQSLQFSQLLQRVYILDEERLEGPLKYLMKIADVSDNTHTGNYAATSEANVRRKLVGHLNAGLNSIGHLGRFRFIGHRLAELRGLFTNIIHNEMIAFFCEIFGPKRCINLLHHTEGVDYILDEQCELTWTPALRRQLAERLSKKFATLQSEQLSQFIKAKPSGITVDASAMQSGASVEVIFWLINNIVQGKRYRLEWCEERNRLVRQDFEHYRDDHSGKPELQEQVMQLLREQNLVPTDSEQLMRGEFLLAYRNFIKEYRAEQLKAVKQDAWIHVARLFGLPPEHDPLYALVDPYRRAYAMARELPKQTIEEMVEDALSDLVKLDAQAHHIRKDRTQPNNETDEPIEEVSELQPPSVTVAYLVDYLERNLEVWDDRPSQLSQPVSFLDTLRRYADPRRLYTQCCYCGSALQASEWMSAQVPPNIGVQSFSNRLEGGSTRDPKRNVCAVCRTQFILEKLAWNSHRDKQGNEQVTFYMHLFPYSYFTKPLLDAWWYSIKRLRDSEHQALWFQTTKFFTTYRDMQGIVDITYMPSRLDGLGIPVYSEAISNTPVLPLIVSGTNYGKQFLVALETTLLLAQWFDCCVLLSRLPTPLLNLSMEQLDKEPVALLIENIPQAMSWLVPQNAFTRKSGNGVKQLCEKMGTLHCIAQVFKLDDEDQRSLIYDVASAATGDPLATYFKLDRRIEQVAQRSKNAIHTAINLSSQVAPMMKDLLEEGERMKQLEALAKHAAQYRIRGRSYKRNSLLKPLAIIFDELERCPNPENDDELNLVKASSKGMISEHIKRIAHGVHEEAIYRYVDLFFDGVLQDAHHKNVNRLLQRERSLRSAYLIYMREALAEIFMKRGQANTKDEAIETLDSIDETPDEDDA